MPNKGKKTVSFSLKPDDYKRTLEYAERKGLSISAFAKMCTFYYQQKYSGAGRHRGDPKTPPD